MSIRFENVYIVGWIPAIRGARNSWESWHKMDSYISPSGRTVIGSNDHTLLFNLAKAGSSHAKYRRYIHVFVDIIAPEYWWRQYHTYKIGTTENSTSQMHLLGKRLLTVEDFSFDDPTDPDNIETVERVNRLIKAWWDAGKRPRSPEWRKLLQNIPQSYNYRKTCDLNYEVLTRIYRERKDHKLQEWRDFCDWIETLPYSELITLERPKPVKLTAKEVAEGLAFMAKEGGIKWLSS